MAEVEYDESVYRFSDPIRIFKANDPYYFEVDNIPLNQLQENCLWLKDQLGSKIQKLQDVKRGDIAELKPYATGGDRKIRVKPGRYSARVNDATSKDPLQVLTQVLGGYGLFEPPGWKAYTKNAAQSANNALLSDALDKFKGIVSANSLQMNGLAERAFTWPLQNDYTPANTTGVNTTGSGKTLSYLFPYKKAPLIATQALLWASSENGAQPDYLLETFDTTNALTGFGLLPYVESHWIKKWRGVTRTAIVDVSEELTVEVPAFDINDFHYTTANGTKQVLQNTQNRIDMVFIYTKPVDSSGVKIWKGGTPTTITKPELGIVRGAGIGPNFTQLTSLKKEYLAEGALDADGNPMILPNASDTKQDPTTAGFLSTSANDIDFDVVGSFPSPDDILNLAPLLSEKLENTAIELVGQSILPVAYVFVRNPATTGVTLPVLASDVIDIRPFFRTTELAYNERAGIAAAMPQLSLANPAVGKAELATELWKLRQYVDGLHEIEPVSFPVCAAGYVMGGRQYGPEGVLVDYWKKQKGNSDAEAAAIVKGYYGYGSKTVEDQLAGESDFSLPTKPQWDVTNWAIQAGGATEYPTDWIDVFSENVAAGPANDNVLADPLQVNLTGKGYVMGASENGNYKVYHEPVGTFGYIQKTINFNRGAVNWMKDYIVDVKFINSIWQGSSGYRNDRGPGNYAANWWVEKRWDSFTIFIAFPLEAPLFNGEDGKAPEWGCGDFTPDNFRNNAQTLAKFLVPVKDILNDPKAMPQVDKEGVQGGYNCGPSPVGKHWIGRSVYPSVMWSLQAIPAEDNKYFYPNLNDNYGQDTISLKNVYG